MWPWLTKTFVDPLRSLINRITTMERFMQWGIGGALFALICIFGFGVYKASQRQAPPAVVTAPVTAPKPLPPVPQPAPIVKAEPVKPAPAKAKKPSYKGHPKNANQCSRVPPAAYQYPIDVVVQTAKQYGRSAAEIAALKACWAKHRAG